MPNDFSTFDQRGYPTVDVRSGYAAWAPTYESTVATSLDLPLLDQLHDVDWESFKSAVDLACGTGRIGTWLRQRGVRRLVGVDVAPEMLQKAAELGIYDRTLEADARETGLDAGSFDLVTECLADEHLPDLAPLYTEAARLLRPGCSFVLVGYHPHFMMQFGMPTHFDGPDGSPVAIETYVHLFEEHASAALNSGFQLVQLRERTIDEEFIASKQKWERYKGHPVSFMFQWRKSPRATG